MRVCCYRIPEAPFGGSNVQFGWRSVMPTRPDCARGHTDPGTGARAAPGVVIACPQRARAVLLYSRKGNDIPPRFRRCDFALMSPVKRRTRGSAFSPTICVGAVEVMIVQRWRRSLETSVIML
jgi:hypothetical protein